MFFYVKINTMKYKNILPINTLILKTLTKIYLCVIYFLQNTVLLKIQCSLFPEYISFYIGIFGNLFLKTLVPIIFCNVHLQPKKKRNFIYDKAFQSDINLAKAISNMEKGKLCSVKKWKIWGSLICCVRIVRKNTERMTGYIFLWIASLIGQIDETFLKPTRNSKNKPPLKSN